MSHHLCTSPFSLAVGIAYHYLPATLCLVIPHPILDMPPLVFWLPCNTYYYCQLPALPMQFCHHTHHFTVCAILPPHLPVLLPPLPTVWVHTALLCPFLPTYLPIHFTPLQFFWLCTLPAPAALAPLPSPPPQHYQHTIPSWVSTRFPFLPPLHILLCHFTYDYNMPTHLFLPYYPTCLPFYFCTGQVCYHFLQLPVLPTFLVPLPLVYYLIITLPTTAFAPYLPTWRIKMRGSLFTLLFSVLCLLP